MQISMNDFQYFVSEDSLITTSEFFLSMKTQKSVTHSVRVERRLYEELSKETSAKSVSFNGLVNQVLTKYIAFDRYVPDLQFIVIDKGLIIKGLEAQSDDQVLSSGRAAGSAFARDTILRMGLPLNKESLLYFIDPVLSQYKNFADCQRYHREGKDVFYLSHDLGAKWSLYLKGYVSGAFKNILQREIEIDDTKDGISFTV